MIHSVFPQVCPGLFHWAGPEWTHYFKYVLPVLNIVQGPLTRCWQYSSSHSQEAAGLFFLSEPHWWLMFNLLSTETPNFLLKLFSRWSTTSKYQCLSISFQFVVPFLKLQEALTNHFSGLLKTLWKNNSLVCHCSQFCIFRLVEGILCQVINEDIRKIFTTPLMTGL